MTFPAAPAAGPVTVRRATADDVPAIASIFGRAFDDYRRGLGVDAPALAALWQSGLAARVDATHVAALASGAVVGFIITVRPGATERYGSPGEGRRRFARWRQTLGWREFWRPPAMFIPMGLAYARRHAQRDELYISLVAVEPALRGQGIGQALLAAAEDEAGACGATAILLHTASTNTMARRAYERAGYVQVCAVRAPWRGPAGIPAYVALRKPLRPDPTPRLDKLAATIRR